MCTNRYYSGEKVAPILTIFIGGNHEASNYLQELPFGGWVAPNIYYLGYASVLNFKGVRIGGLSGIYKGFDYFKGHFECPPYNENTKRSVYHYRQQETYRLQQLKTPIDILMSHDWPTDVYNYGNAGQLMNYKRHFRDEILENRLGSPPLFKLLKKLKPTYWFSGHLHCKFAAVIPHEDGTQTKFLALDKCLPNKRFLQIIDIETPNDDGSDQLKYDLEWLTILYTTKHLTHVRNSPVYMPGEGNTNVRWDFTPTADEKDVILKRFDGNLNVPFNFERTAAPYDPNNVQIHTFQPKPVKNPQTVHFCNILDIDDPLNLIVILSGNQMSHTEYRDVVNASVSDSSLCLNESDRPEDISLTENTLNSTASSGGVSNLTLLNQRLSLFDTLPAPKGALSKSMNLEELDIDLSDDDDDEEEAEELKYQEEKGDSILIAELTDTITDERFLKQVEDIASIKTTEKRDNEDETVSPTLKKFKRRNAAIYNADDDE